MKYDKIFLIGFRGTGKSTFGKTLAQNLGLSFLNMDFLISQESGESIDILTKNGTDWTRFREMENNLPEEIVKMKNIVISCGGGVGVNNVLDSKTGKTFGELNKEILTSLSDSLIILLTANKRIIEERLTRQFANKKIMPFLNQENAKEIETAATDKKSLIKRQVEDSMKTLDKREKLYEELADFEIDTSKFSLPEKLVNLNISIGDPISHSLSPVMHNTGYKALGIEQSNLFIAVRVKKEKLEKLIEAVKILGINGISITLPHKENVIRFLDELDTDAEKMGAVNTVLNKEGILKGYNTDWVGAISALEKKTSLRGKRVAVIGAGGAARAIVYGLVEKGAQVKIFNRSVDKAEELAREFGSEFADLESLAEVAGMDIIINTTSVGMNEDRSLIDENYLNKNQLIFDIVYSPKETRLIKDALEKGAKVIYGYEMLLYQGAEQFKLYTGLYAPIKEMEEALLENL